MTPREQTGASRRRLLAARRAQPPEVRAARGAALAAAVVELARAVGPEGTLVCAYLPVGIEPAWASGLDGLRAAGYDVLLPVVPPLRGPLEWAPYLGAEALTAGPLGLLEPTGPRLGPAAVARAGLVLVPALAADRRGVRLGQGGGYYDRTWPLADPATPLVVVHNDEELVAELPAEPHDRRVNAALLAERGMTRLGDSVDERR